VTADTTLYAVWTAVAPAVDKTALETAITDANTLIGSVTVGIAVGDVSSADAATFQTAINAAQVVDSSTTAVQADVDAAVAALATATTNFNSAVITVAPVAINTAAIAGVTVPVTGATPVSTITATSEYTAAISWNGSPVTFAASTVYTATITITPLTGYTLRGVTENFFTVAGAVYSNTAGSGVVTAAFPATAATVISPGGGGGGSVTVYTPVVQTEAATVVSSTSITLNGDITSDSGYNVTDYGFMWGTSASSLTNKLDVGTNNQSGTFTDTLSITPGTTYYFEAYATNSYGTADGAVLSYPTNMPAVQTEAATSVTDSSAVLNGDITSGSGYTVTDYGFMWGTSASTLTNKLDAGANNQSGAFTDTLSNLTTGTTYYFEAYATDSSGTADGAVMSFTAGVQTPSTSTGIAFSDVPSSYWGYNIITNLSSRGIVAGYTDGTFKPNAAITRAEFAVMLVKALGLNITGTTSAFSDVAQGSWLYGSVNAAAAAGLVTGYGGTTQFGPYTLITREQMAVMVAKALGTKAPSIDGTELNAFKDGSLVSSWATTGVDQAVKTGIVIGMSAVHLAPLAHATRAQAAAMIYQMLSFLGK
jgi:hypothetical protein